MGGGGGGGAFSSFVLPPPPLNPWLCHWGGFRSHRRCSDQWLVFRGVCELKMDLKATCLVFLDVSKAYDSVWKERLWCKIRHYGVEEKFVKVCEGLYSGVETRVVMTGAKSRWFGVERGQARVFFISNCLIFIGWKW